MKKLAVVVMMIAIAAFMVPALASADDWGHGGAGHGIKGLYAVTGFSTCSPVGPGIFEADYTFKGDGTGSVRNGFIRNITPSGPVLLTYTAAFTYEVTHEGRITFEYPLPLGGNHVKRLDEHGNTVLELIWSLGPGHGVISPDGKTITITCGPPVVLEILESTNPALEGNTTSCVTTAVGIRLH